MIRKHLPWITALFCLCAAVVPARGQRNLLYAGIPWRIGADSARALLERQGFTFSRVDKDGDHEYTRGDGAQLYASLQGGRLVGVMLVDGTRGAGVDARYRTLADSLEAAVGKPDTVYRSLQEWEVGLTALEVANSYEGSAHHVEISWRGPGYMDEIERRSEALHPGKVILSPRPPGFTIVSSSGLAQIVVDTTRLVRRAGVQRGRFRIEYVRSVGPDSALYDSAEYDMEFDCAGGRTRLLSRTTRLSGQVRRSETFSTLPWETPRPDGHYARGLRAVCRVAEVRARPAARP
jgi:hypothetical protein